MSDLIITGGPIHPRADQPATVEALLVRDGKVAGAGRLADMRLAASGRVRLHDLGGGVALPGLADSHLHLLWAGLATVGLDVAKARSLAELRAAVGQRAAALPAGAWIVGHGWDLSDSGGRMPEAADLDDVSPDHPVLLRRKCGHVAVANSAALQLAGLNRHSPDPAGGAVERGRDGTPTGLLRERAVELVAACQPPPSRKEVAAALRRAARECLAAGLTAVHSDDLRQAQDLPLLLDVCRDLFRRDGLPLRVDLHLDGFFLRQAHEMGLRTGLELGAEPGWLRVGGAKFFSDGSLGGRTAALRRPYADDPTTSGLLVASPSELAQQAVRARQHGFQPVIHAIGDRGADAALSALAAAAAVPASAGWHAAVGRPRLVHAQVLAPDLVTRLRSLRVVAEIQPSFVVGDMMFASARLGPERLAHAYAWQTLLQAGVPCAGGSDFPVEPPDPVRGIWAAVGRQGPDGEPASGWLPDERLILAQALHLFTEGAAYASAAERERGRLEAGYVADLTVLSGEPWATPPAELAGLTVAQTIVGGEVAYAR